MHEDTNIQNRYNSPAPFSGCYVLGPYTYSNNRARSYVFVCDPVNKTKLGLLVSRYIAMISLGKRLDPEIHVDHVDGDPSNDSVDNLQLLSLSLNASKGSSSQFITRTCFICPVCGTQAETRKRPSDIRSLAFCSRECNYAFLSLSKNMRDEAVVSAAKLKFNTTVVKRSTNKSWIEGTRLPEPSTDVLSFLAFISRDRSTPIKNTKPCKHCSKLTCLSKTFCSPQCAQSFRSKMPETSVLLSAWDSCKNFEALGRKFNVTGACVKKWLKKLNVIGS